MNPLLTQKIKKCIWCRFGTVPCVKRIQPLIQAAWAMLGHGLGHVWQFGSLILTIIKILKFELLVLQC